MKNITISTANLSKTLKKKLKRFGSKDEFSSSYTIPACLIAQLGKKYSLQKDEQIPDSVLLDYAISDLKSIQRVLGGLIVFLECLEENFLLKFYKENGFVEFGTRTAHNKDNNSTKIYHQFLKIL